MRAKQAMPNVAAPLVLVLWVDSSGQDRWSDVADAKALPDRGLRCLSIGWVLRDDSQALVIAPHASMNQDGDFDSVRGHLAIPRVAIQRVQVIRKATSRA